MGSELEPAGSTAVAPAAGNLPAVPAPAPQLPATIGTTNPVAGNGVTREMGKPAGGAVPANLSRESWLDLISRQMHELNNDLTRIGAQLDVLQKTADALDLTITNMEELGKRVEAPQPTRSALDADSMVSSLISDVVRQTTDHAFRTQTYNAHAFLALGRMRDVQDHQRGMGAGPKLLNTAGR